MSTEIQPAEGVRLITADCKEALAAMPANSVQMVCTSPPY